LIPHRSGGRSSCQGGHEDSCGQGVYARYSSDNQRDASIDDQVRICRAEIERHGWHLAQIYTNPAISGASTFRPGYQKLLQDASTGGLDLVVAEGLDRLFRDLAEVATLYKQLSYWGIGLVTVAEGPITDLHVGLKGTMNALALKEIAHKTHRGDQLLDPLGQTGRRSTTLAYGPASARNRNFSCLSVSAVER